MGGIVRLTAGLVGLVVALLVSPAEIPSSPKTSQPLSCKTASPLTIQVLPGAAPQTWSLRLGSADADRHVNVWMWSASEAERRLVWRGPLVAGQERRLDVGFAVTGAVWAAVESAGGAESGLRAVAGTAHGGRAATLAAEPGTLLQNPLSGETIIQYTGRPEGGR